MSEHLSITYEDRTEMAKYATVYQLIKKQMVELAAIDLDLV